MNLTKLERLSLINQFEIRKRLEKTDAYDEWIKVLEEGYSLWYSEIFRNLSDDLSEEDCRFVSNVLSMYRAIHYYRQSAKEPLKDTTFAEFAGFSGNEEGHLRSFALFEIHKDNSWDEQKSREQETDRFNSHMPVRDVYERMLRVYKGLTLDAMSKLTKEQVEQVLAAASYPGNK